MIEGRDRPSKWWFWGPVIAANVYAVGMCALSWTGALEQLSMLGPQADLLYDVLVAPALAFAKLVTAWGLSDAYRGDLLAELALWELGAVLVGLVLYAAMALRCRQKKQGADSAARSKGDD